MKKLLKFAGIVVGLFVGIAVIVVIAGDGGTDGTTTASGTAETDAEPAATEADAEPTAGDTTEKEPAPEPEPEPEPADEPADDTIGGHDIPADEDLYLNSLDDILVNSYSADDLLTYGYAVCDQMEAMHDDGNAADAFGPDTIQAFADEHGLDSFDAGAIQGAAGSLCPSISLKVGEDALDDLDY